MARCLPRRAEPFTVGTPAGGDVDGWVASTIGRFSDDGPGGTDSFVDDMFPATALATLAWMRHRSPGQAPR